MISFAFSMMMMPRRPPSASYSFFPLKKFFVVLFLLHVDPVVCCRRYKNLDLFLEELEFQKILRKVKHFNKKHISLFLVLPLNPPTFFARWRSNIFDVFYLISSLLRRRRHSKPSLECDMKFAYISQMHGLNEEFASWDNGIQFMAMSKKFSL